MRRIHPVVVVAIVVAIVAAIVLVAAFRNRESDRSPGRDSVAELTGKGEVPTATRSALDESLVGRAAPRASDSGSESALAEDLVPSAEDDLDAQQQEIVELARIMMSSSLAEFFPNLDPSEDQIADLASATVRLGEAQARLAQLAPGTDNDVLRQALSDEVAAAAEEFSELMEMTMDDFDSFDNFDDFDNTDDTDGATGSEDGFDDSRDSEDLFDPFEDEALTENPD